jgi:hypothetical protein
VHVLENELLLVAIPAWQRKSEELNDVVGMLLDEGRNTAIVREDIGDLSEIETAVIICEHFNVLHVAVCHPVVLLIFCTGIHLNLRVSCSLKVRIIQINELSTEPSCQFQILLPLLLQLPHQPLLSAALPGNEL